MIELKDLHISYGSHEVLTGLSLSIPKGQIHGIVGLNGAGKTTLFLSMMNGIPLEAGSIIFEGVTLKRSQVSYLETDPFFYPYLTGYDYLDLFHQNGDKFDPERLQHLFHLPLKDLIDTYSTGMRKKLAFMGILKQNRPIVILDEPFNGIDLETYKVFEVLIQKLKDLGKTLLISSHILLPLQHICDALHLIEKGKVHKSFLPTEIGEVEKELFGSYQATLKDELRGLF